MTIEPETDAPPHLKAVLRWFSLGTTSATNPILGLLFDKLFAPLGLRCEYMDCEPLSDPGALIKPVFCRPTWSLELGSDAFPELLPPAAIMECYTVDVRQSGHIQFTRKKGVPHTLLSAMDMFDDGKPLNAFIEECRITTSRLVIRGFDAACLPTSKPENSELLLQSPAQFAEQLWQAVIKTDQAPL